MGKPLTLNRPIKAGTIHEIAKSVKGSAYTYYYNILITYASGDPGKIYKKYEDFVELHMQLLGHFPEAAGGAQNKNVQILLDQKSENRILPEIPPQVLVVTDSIAQSRAVNLQLYIDVSLIIDTNRPWLDFLILTSFVSTLVDSTRLASKNIKIAPGFQILQNRQLVLQ